jgi:hypothetical protein
MAGSIQRPRATWAARLALGLCGILLTSAVARPAAHDIPASVSVHAFVRPEGQKLRVILRVPLTSMRDFNFPVRDGALLDLVRAQPMAREAAMTWLGSSLVVFEEDRALGRPELAGMRISLPSDRSFESFEGAAARIAAGPDVPPETALPVTSALLDVEFDYPISSDRSRFSIDPLFARLGLRVVTVLRFKAPDAAERAFEFLGDPGIVRLDPRWHQAALTFVRLGFHHILDGIDHLLFLFCLVLPLRRFGQLVVVVTAFTVAHSITLFAAAFGLAPDALWFPPLVEALIALSIVYMALENIVVWVTWWAGPYRRGTDTLTHAPQAPTPALHGRWMIAFVFGLVHGFGFSFALKQTLQFAGAHLVTSLVSFNVGVELGQLLVLAILAPVLALLFKWVIEERLGVIIASAFALHTAWHWLTERATVLTEYDWSLSDPATLARLLRVLMVIVAAAGGAWVIRAYRKR